MDKKQTNLFVLVIGNILTANSEIWALTRRTRTIGMVRIFRNVHPALVLGPLKPPSFNTPYKFKRLLNLRSLSFDLRSLADGALDAAATVRISRRTSGAV